MSGNPFGGFNPERVNNPDRGYGYKQLITKIYATDRTT